ncbi:hypothetical protein HMH01_08470 [Halovulum dunhuangense]|uniref:Histidine phosphotransferase ChpT C-terminal domain-containing protein n=1 Tax=Halovulum dunhuangense TaxID=1505036 RepID=A0A849L2I1_9RHOB|nr:histidine phosphotransferase family protein [Halovulum dunhuangense]NNU80473.1 hypothetical protein [Halovulum dunhuangense]
MTHPDLTGLVSSRICHDLVNPVGAIGNGVELLSCLGRTTAAPELELIADSVNATVQKLRLFRLAFGDAAPQDRVALAELRPILGALVSGRWKLVLTVEGSELPRTTAKAALLALLCKEHCLPLGGETRLVLSAGAVGIETTAPRLRDAEALWRLLEHPDAEARVRPAEVQFLLLGQLLQARGARATRATRENGMSLDLRRL